MNKSILTRLFEHTNWANLQIMEACCSLSDEQLNAEPQTTTKGSIRSTLQHLINSQEDYLSQLMGIEPRFNWQTPPDFDELRQAATNTGEGLIALTRDESRKSMETKFEKDGYSVEPWLVMVQAINHATEHREQIKSMLSNLGITPPRIDGWAYGKSQTHLFKYHHNYRKTPNQASRTITRIMQWALGRFASSSFLRLSIFLVGQLRRPCPNAGQCKPLGC